MEARKNQLKRNGTHSRSDSESFLPSRPAGSHTLLHNENAFPGKDCSFSQRQKSSAGLTKKKSDINSRWPEKHDDSSSDDPLDSLSENSPKKSLKRVHIDANGKEHVYPPGFDPTKSDRLKTLKFSKIKNAQPEGSQSPVVDLVSRDNTPLSVYGDHKPVPRKPLGSFLSQDKSVVPPLPCTNSSPPKEKPSRPRPRPVKSAKDTMKQKKSQSVQIPREHKDIVESCPRSRSPSVDILDAAPNVTIPQPFPMDITSRSSHPASSSKPSGSLLSLKPKPFPLSPPRSSSASPAPTKKAQKPKPFPMASPPRSVKYTNLKKGKGKKASRTSSECDSDSNEVAPFPLLTQFFDKAGSPPKPRKKRYSAGLGLDTSPRKRSKGDNILLEDEPFEEDSFFISETTDPKTLCPYCDNPLPPSPSPALLHLLSTMTTKSTRDPRPANPLGRKAPFATFIALCQRHRFETDILPDADRKGWPKVIDWKRLSNRIEEMQPTLQLLIDDSTDHGPRFQCAFWLEIMEAVKAKGSRAAVGVKDQFLNFEKTQPGYYGELGSVIIHQTLYNLFPPVSIDVDAISPLGPEEFLQRVLLPEVALRLIMEDKSLRGESGRKNALRILRESSAYGVAMFPADTMESGQKAKKLTEGISAGDTIVMERARKRRKEIEEEDAKEEAERVRMNELRAAKPKPKPRRISKKSTKSSVGKTDDEAPEDIMQYDTDLFDDDLSDYRADESDANSEVVVSSQPIPPTRQSRSPSITLFEENGKKSGNQPPAATNRRKEQHQEASPSEWNTNDDESGAKASTSVDDEPFTKTPKANKIPKFREPSVRLVDDQPTPRPSRQTLSSQSKSPPGDMAPLRRAKALKKQNQAVKIVPASPVTPGNGASWIHSMDASYTGIDDESLMDIEVANFNWLLRDRSSSHSSFASPIRH